MCRGNNNNSTCSSINADWIVKSIKAFIVNTSSRSYYIRAVRKTNCWYVNKFTLFFNSTSLVRISYCELECIISLSDHFLVSKVSSYFWNWKNSNLLDSEHTLILLLKTEIKGIKTCIKYHKNTIIKINTSKIYIILFIMQCSLIQKFDLFLSKIFYFIENRFNN